GVVHVTLSFVLTFAQRKASSHLEPDSEVKGGPDPSAARSMFGVLELVSFAGLHFLFSHRRLGSGRLSPPRQDDPYNGSDGEACDQQAYGEAVRLDEPLHGRRRNRGRRRLGADGYRVVARGREHLIEGPRLRCTRTDGDVLP